MKTYYVLFAIVIFAAAASAQLPADVLATATGHTIKLNDLSTDTQKALAGFSDTIAKARSQELEQLIFERVLDAEANARSTTAERIIADEKAKVPAPTEAEIKAVYDANQAALGGRTLVQTRKQIVAFLRGEPEQKLLESLFNSLKAKYNVTKGKDVNAAGLQPTDSVVTIAGKAVTAREFDENSRDSLYEVRAQLAEMVIDDVTAKLVDALVLDEAHSLNMDAPAYIAREVSNKMKEFSDDERTSLLDAMQAKLFAKYKANILYKMPDPIVRNVSVDDDPATGPIGAPVTIVMFSDFQCPACSAAHPLLKQAMAMFPGKIRFVVRDFPLESIHENAFRAALAAGAANLQGKFFDYSEILYTHQDALDAASLKKYAAELGLNAKQFELDFNSEKVAAEVRKDIADGKGYGINSTPTIYINGIKARDLSVAGFKAAIERALKK
ncbi:MAG: thioredoxin domain-containing protein [Acidobacteriota bacterium]